MDAIINFIQLYLPYNDREQIEDYIRRHQQYGTFDYAMDTDGKIVSVVRWNVDGETWDILDYAVREDFRNRGVGTDMIRRGLERFPDGKFIRFKRAIRGDERYKVLSIENIIKRKLL